MTVIESTKDQRPWEEVAAAKRAIRDGEVAKHHVAFKNFKTSAHIMDIGDVSSLTKLLECGSVSAEEVITAYIQRSVECERHREALQLTEVQGMPGTGKGTRLLFYITIHDLIDNQQTNCLTEICFDEAIARARFLDDFQRQNGRLMGPLHGVPISLKDQFNVKGKDSTLGYVGHAFAPATSNALLVDALLHLGAVIIAKTNLPQSIMVCPLLAFCGRLY